MSSRAPNGETRGFDGSVCFSTLSWFYLIAIFICFHRTNLLVFHFPSPYNEGVDFNIFKHAGLRPLRIKKLTADRTRIKRIKRIEVSQSVSSVIIRG